MNFSFKLEEYQNLLDKYMACVLFMLLKWYSWLLKENWRICSKHFTLLILYISLFSTKFNFCGINVLIHLQVDKLNGGKTCRNASIMKVIWQQPRYVKFELDMRLTRSSPLKFPFPFCRISTFYRLNIYKFSFWLIITRFKELGINTKLFFNRKTETDKIFNILPTSLIRFFLKSFSNVVIAILCSFANLCNIRTKIFIPVIPPLLLKPLFGYFSLNSGKEAAASLRLPVQLTRKTSVDNYRNKVQVYFFTIVSYGVS